MQFYTLIELCDAHYRLLCEKLPFAPKLEKEPRKAHGFCFFHETPHEVCEQSSSHFVYLVTEPVDLRLMASAKGGSATTEAKQRASRDNGSKGGRPHKNPNLFKTANGLNILKLTETDYKVVYADGSPAANNKDGSDAIFGTFLEAELHAKSWRPSYVVCPSCRVKTLRTNQAELQCSGKGCKSVFSFR